MIEIQIWSIQHFWLNYSSFSWLCIAESQQSALSASKFLKSSLGSKNILHIFCFFFGNFYACCAYYLHIEHMFCIFLHLSCIFSTCSLHNFCIIFSYFFIFVFGITCIFVLHVEHKKHFLLTDEGIQNAENTKNAGDATCGTVPVIDHRVNSWHKSDSLQCVEPWRASNQITAVEILDCWAVIRNIGLLGSNQ